MQGLGPDSDYVCYDAFWSEDVGYPGAKELGRTYKAEHDGLDSVSIGLFYANVQILKEAIERAGSTEPAAVRDEVFGGLLEGTAIGDVQYDEGGVVDIPPLGLQSRRRQHHGMVQGLGRTAKAQPRGSSRVGPAEENTGRAISVTRRRSRVSYFRAGEAGADPPPPGPQALATSTVTGRPLTFSFSR
jgi:hypothetical protein